MAKRDLFFNRQQVLLNDMQYEQAGRIFDSLVRVSDFWTDGVLGDPNGLSNLIVTVDALTNTLINVGPGTAYGGGRRILVSGSQGYSAGAPFTTTNGVCTPQSTGNKAIPLSSYVRGQSNFVWIQNLATIQTTPFELDPTTGAVNYVQEDDGYLISVTTTNPPGNTTGLTNAVFLGTVFAQGPSTPLVSAPLGITDVSRQLASLIPQRSIGAGNLQIGAVTPQAIAPVTGFCFTTLIVSQELDVPILPPLPTSAVSRRFAQRTGFGFASSKTTFRPSYDGNNRVITITLSGDNVGSATPVYDGLSNITTINEVIDGSVVSHTFTYATVNGASVISSYAEVSS